jgi:hypothetical protein
MTVITSPIAYQIFYRGDSRQYFQVSHGVFFPSLSLTLLAEAQAAEPSPPSLQDQCEETYLQPYDHVDLLPLLDPPDLSKSDDYTHLLL